MVDIQDVASRYALDMLNHDHGREYIENELIQKGHDEKFVKELVQECVKLRYAKRRAQGLKLIL